MYIHSDTYKPLLAPHYKGTFPVISESDKFFVIDFRVHNNVVSKDRLKAANLSFEALNTKVATGHSTSLQDNHSMPATPPSPEESHPIQIRHKPDSPSHNCISPLHPLQPSFDGTHVTTYPHGLQTRRGRPVKPPERFRDFV